MRYVEDFLEHLDYLLMAFPYNPPPGSQHPSDIITTWDQKFISDVTTHTRNGSSLSSAQLAVVLKIFGKYSSLFDQGDQAAVLQQIHTPELRKELYKSVQMRREVRHAGGSILLFRFKYNPAITSAIADLSGAVPSLLPKYLHQSKLWRVNVDNSNYKRVMKFIKDHNFEFDDDVLSFFMHSDNNLGKLSRVESQGDTISVSIENDIMACVWLEEMAEYAH